MEIETNIHTHTYEAGHMMSHNLKGGMLIYFKSGLMEYWWPIYSELVPTFLESLFFGLNLLIKFQVIALLMMDSKS